MTREEARALVVEYDNACAACEKKPGSKTAERRYWNVFNRLINALAAADGPSMEARRDA